MHKRITFRHMEHSDLIQEHAEKKLVKVVEFLETGPSPIYIDLVMEPSKTREHSRIELHVKTPEYDKITHREFQGDKFYDVLDYVIDTMYKELHEEKRRLVDKRKESGREDKIKEQK